MTGRIRCASVSMSGLWRARQQSFHNISETEQPTAGCQGGPESSRKPASGEAALSSI